MKTLLLFAVCLGSSTCLAQNLIVNGSFEAPIAGPTFTNRSGNFGPGNGWSIGGNIDHIGGFWVAADGQQSVDLNGASSGSVAQTLTTTPGRLYKLRYAASENFFGLADKTMTVTWNGTLIDDVVITHDAARTTTNVKWAYRTVFVIATTNASTLAFNSTTGFQNGSQGFAAFYGPAIDDVSVELSNTCPGDLNNDQFVDDADFTIFAAAYNILDCADPAMPASCPADLNRNGFVDDADFTIFAAAYNELLCP
ncbi:MAG: DUF642 domain-containing protein [Phycisphaerales bacterium]|nr:DUF642 domain-containing protein [Phycisphaerales bacterium]